MTNRHEKPKQGTATGLEGGIAPKTGVEGKSREADLDPTSSGTVVGSASAPAERGVSNTPAAEPTQNKESIEAPKGVATSIDWLKVRFDGEFKPTSDPDWIYRPIFDAMNIDPLLFNPRRGVTGYTRGYQYSSHINVFAGGPKTLSKEGKETWVLELTGQGCREFEKYVVNGGPCGLADVDIDPFTAQDFQAMYADPIHLGWTKLIDAILLCGGRCTRIDIPTDDLDNLVPLPELKEKIQNHVFTSSLRSVKVDKSALPKDETEGFDAPAHYQTSAKGGWTATLGTRESFQVVIYDKKAEIEAHHPEWGNICDHWVRFEVRFYHEQAFNILWQLDKAFKEGRMAVHRFIVGSLGSLLDVKEKRTKSHKEVFPTWDKWKEFIKIGTEFQRIPPAKEHNILKRNALWLKDDTVRAFFRVAACYPDKIPQICAYLILNGIYRSDNSDLFIINEYLANKNRKPYPEIVEAQKRVFLALGFDESSIDNDILTLFDAKLVEEAPKTEGGDK